jgi:hypothetical protein
VRWARANERIFGYWYPCALIVALSTLFFRLNSHPPDSMLNGA